jgi:hypothetical protein
MFMIMWRCNGNFDDRSSYQMLSVTGTATFDGFRQQKS